MHLNKHSGGTALLALICLLTMDFVSTLRDVRVKIPHAVRRGEKATLMCLYDLEDDTLYSVKWYKGRREFYSFTPKDTPAMKVFQFQGVKIDRSSSNESQLVLDVVNMATTGKYSCEVSADAPSFHTLISAGELEVVEVPGKDPIITGIRPRYRVGDIVRGNCTSRHSKPAANLTWTINGYETNPSHIRHHKPIKDSRELETAVSGIHFVVTPQHFLYGKLKIRCTAHIHDVYWKSTEKSIEEERHKHNPSNSINMVNNFSEDYFDLEDGNLMDRSDTYMTHIKGDVSSLNSGAIGTQHSHLPILPRLMALLLLCYTMQQMLQLWQQLFHYKTTTSKTTTTSAPSTPVVAATKSDVDKDDSDNTTKGQFFNRAKVANATIWQVMKYHKKMLQIHKNENEIEEKTLSLQTRKEQQLQQQQQQQEQCLTITTKTAVVAHCCIALFELLLASSTMSS